MLAAGAHASARESIARDARTDIHTRYREAKSTSPSTNREIALACEGEILKDFVLPYYAEMDRNHVQKDIVPSYKDAYSLIQSHQADAENIYPKLRQNLVTAVRQVINDLRSQNKLAAPPAVVTLDNYGGKELLIDLLNCNDTAYINTVAGLAPLSGSFNDYAESPTYRIPIGQNDGDFGTADDAPMEPVQTVVRQKLGQWLYEIYKR
jgi:hypothetical protein